MESKGFESLNTPESKEKFGRNVEFRLLFTRHGEKDSTGNLTAFGKKQAENVGRSLKKRQAIKGSVAPVTRVIETTQSILDSAPHDKKMNIRTRAELGYQASEDFIKRFRTAEVKGGDSAPQWFLDFGKDKPDATTPSPHEVAQQLASLVMHYADMTKKLYSGSTVDMILGTQQGLPEALLKEILLRFEGERKVTGFKNLAEIGGALAFAETIEVKIVRDNNGDASFKIHLRGKEYDLDVEKLHTLAGAVRTNR